jgi:hypothetical protein
VHFEFSGGAAYFELIGIGRDKYAPFFCHF